MSASDAYVKRVQMQRRLEFQGRGHDACSPARSMVTSRPRIQAASSHAARLSTVVRCLGGIALRPRSVVRRSLQRHPAVDGPPSRQSTRRLADSRLNHGRGAHRPSGSKSVASNSSPA